MTNPSETTVPPLRIDSVAAPSTAFVGAAAVFFAGSAVLFRSGQPGASTPTPWLVSHLLWFLSAALLAVGTAATLRRRPAVRRGLAGALAAGTFGLSALHVLQWSAWVYADVFAYEHGAHGALFDPLLHPFGTAHALGYGVLIGGGIALLARGLVRTRAVGRVLGWIGIAIGAATVTAAAVAFVTFADATRPASLATVALLAACHAWTVPVGIALGRSEGGSAG